MTLVTSRIKKSLDFLSSFNFTAKKWKVWWNIGSWCWMPLGYLLFCHCDLIIRHWFLCCCGKLISSNTFCTRYFLYFCSLLQFLELRRDTFALPAPSLNWNKASQIEIFTRKTIRTTQPYYVFLLLILILNQPYHQTHSWLANIYYS